MKAMLNHYKNKIPLIIFIVCILYISSMIDGRAIYDPGELINCQVGKYTFELEKKHCKDTFEYKFNQIISR